MRESSGSYVLHTVPKGTKEGFMAQTAQIEPPGLLTRTFFNPKQERQPTRHESLGSRHLAEHALPDLGGSLWRHRVVREDRRSASRPAQRPSGRALQRAVLNGHPSRRRREDGCPGGEARRCPRSEE